MAAQGITYLQPAVMTAPGAYGPLLAGLPSGIAAVAEAAHGLLIHEHLAGSYGVTLTVADRASVHIRPVAGLLEQITAQDPRPLTAARAPANRLPGNCRHFTVLAAWRPCARRARPPGPDAVSAATSARARSRTTGCASTGTRPRSAGRWPTRRSTTCSGGCSGSTST
jgi:hypothetical protein